MTTLSATGRAMSTLTTRTPPTLRRLWMLAAAFDLAWRVASMRGVQRELAQMVDIAVPSGLRQLGTMISLTPTTLAPQRRAQLHNAMRALRIARLLFEAYSVVRILLLLRQATAEAGRRATNALRRSFRFQSLSTSTSTATATAPSSTTNLEQQSATFEDAPKPTSSASSSSKQQSSRRMSALGLTAVAATATAVAAYTSTTMSSVKDLPLLSFWSTKK